VVLCVRYNFARAGEGMLTLAPNACDRTALFEILAILISQTARNNLRWCGGS